MITTVDRLFEALSLRHFATAELDTLHHQSGNTPPPPGLIENLAMPLVVADELRELLGSPAVITSAYRCPSYNRMSGGRPLSNHQAATAFDLFFPKLHRQEDVAEILRIWRGQKFPLPIFPHQKRVGEIPFELSQVQGVCGGSWEFVFRGGVGQGPDYTHFDTRGLDATWYY